MDYRLSSTFGFSYGNPRNVMVASGKLLSIVGFISLFLFNNSYADKYSIIRMPADWTLAENVCMQHKAMLIADMYDDIENSDLYNELPVGEFIWINAKTLEINYTRSSQTIKLAYKPVNSRLEYFICQADDHTTRKKDKTLTTWNNARQVCEKNKCDLLDVSSFKDVRRSVSLLGYDQATWVNKYTKYELPNYQKTVIDKFTSQCVGIMKHLDGSVSMHVDDCAHKHMYICANDRDDYAPTLTRLEMPLTLYIHPAPPDTITTENRNQTVPDHTLSFNNSKSSASLIDSDELSDGSVAGIIVGAVLGLLILLTLLGVLYYRKRWTNRQAYKNSLRNYTNRQTSRRIATGSFSRDTMKSVNSTQNMVGEACVGEDCRDLDRYISGPVAGSSPTLYQSNQGYQIMIGKKQVQSYEGFDPDIGHLQKIHGYVNTPNTDRQNGEQYDIARTGEVPKLPKKMKKNKKKQPLNDLATNENHSKPADEQVHLDDLDQYENEELGKGDKNMDSPYEKPVKCLNDLDSYENYQRPQRRERGNYRITKNNAVVAPMSSHMSRNNADYSMAKSIDELDNYENFDSPHTKHKELQAYVDEENYYDM